MSETQVKIKKGNKCMERNATKNGNVYKIVTGKNCVDTNTTTQVFIKAGSNYKQTIGASGYYLHKKGAGYELQTASTGAVSSVPSTWTEEAVEDDTTTYPAPAPVSDAPAPAGTPPDDPDDDEDEPWATRKAWILERWIWIVIGTGVGCFFFAIALYFFGRGGGRR